LKELAAGAQWSAGSDGPKAKATVNDTRIAVRAAAMQSSDRRGVSVARERPERSEEPANLAKSGNSFLPGDVEKRGVRSREVQIERGASMSLSKHKSDAHRADAEIRWRDETFGAGMSPMDIACR
jgi:hypothetical protein